MGPSEGEDCGLELPGNLAFPWSPPSVRSILCALAEPLFLVLSPQSCRGEGSPTLPASHYMCCCGLGAEGHSVLLRERLCWVASSEILLTELLSLRHGCGWQNAHTL